MADERCVFPGGNPRPPGRWLDRDAAERLLRGERFEALDADSRDQADRLAEALDALGALTAETVPTSTELPGEAAAVAAFHAARTGRNAEEAKADLGRAVRTRSPAPSSPPGTSLDAGLVRLGRAATDRRAPSLRGSLWGRPVRYGLASALAAGMLGGVAVVATAGVLAFGGDEPEPGASATVAVTPDRSFVEPSPGKTRGGADEPRPDGSAGSPTGENSVPGGEARGDTGADTGAQPDSDDTRRANRPGQRWARIASACRDLSDGKDLDSGRRRALEDAAHGAEQVQRYCKGILKNWDRHDSDDDRRGHGAGSGHSDASKGDSGSGRGKGGDEGGGGDGGDGGDHDGGDHSHIGQGTFRGDDGTAHREGGAAEPSGFAPALPPVSDDSARTPAPQVSASRKWKPPASVTSPVASPVTSAVPSPVASAVSDRAHPAAGAAAASARRLPSTTPSTPSTLSTSSSRS
ncbi:hypothetical protein AB0D14_36620 [Streptomyces sp. NPDC048484]|uniref:hypothetical protein n=1 Tax=Streptomyces sp. NPDC048484 TaxID=3155146 RepID=UPI0034444A20